MQEVGVEEVLASDLPHPNTESPALRSSRQNQGRHDTLVYDNLFGSFIPI